MRRSRILSRDRGAERVKATIKSRIAELQLDRGYVERESGICHSALSSIVTTGRISSVEILQRLDRVLEFPDEQLIKIVYGMLDRELPEKSRLERKIDRILSALERRES